MKTVIRLFTLVALIALRVPVPAIQVPQARREFVEAVAGGARSVKMETFAVERSFGEVYAILKKRAIKCLEVQVRRSGFVGNQIEVSSTDRRSGVTSISDRRRGDGTFPAWIARRFWRPGRSRSRSTRWAIGT